MAEAISTVEVPKELQEHGADVLLLAGRRSGGRGRQLLKETGRGRKECLIRTGN